MFIEAISTVQVQAALGHEAAVGDVLQRMVAALEPHIACQHYRVMPCPATTGLWLISSHWRTRLAMEAHFCDPVLALLVGLLATRTVQRIHFDSFYNQSLAERA